MNRLGGRRLSSRLPGLASGVVSSAGHAAVAVVLAGGLVTGGLTALMVAADRTLDAAPTPRVAAGPAVTPLPGTLRVDGATPAPPGGPSTPPPTTGPTPRPSGSDRAPATLDDPPGSPSDTDTPAAGGTAEPTVTEPPTEQPTARPTAPTAPSGSDGKGKDHGQGHAYGHGKDHGKGHANGHDKDHGQGNANGHGKDRTAGRAGVDTSPVRPGSRSVHQPS